MNGLIVMEERGALISRLSNCVVAVLFAPVSPEPIPREVRIVPATGEGFLPYDDSAIRAILKSWVPDLSAPRLKSSDVQGVRLAALTAEMAMRHEAMKGAVKNASNFEPGNDVDLSKVGMVLPFRNSRDLRAHLERLSAAVVYARAISQGDQAPVQRVAKELGLTSEKAKRTVALARQSGYLSSGSHGSVGGHLTDKALEHLWVEQEMK